MEIVGWHHLEAHLESELTPYDRHSLESCSAVSCTGSCIAALASTALYCGAVAKRSQEARSEVKNLSICNYDSRLATSTVVMNSSTSTNVGSPATSHTTDTTARPDHDRGGSNSKDSDSEGEGAEEQWQVSLFLEIFNFVGRCCCCENGGQTFV
uniref:Uncharacterized protein n=1 Tax=Elaeophora elaphi TaxID=1147741 RepID=A0A0R3RTQ6_9BILA